MSVRLPHLDTFEIKLYDEGVLVIAFNRPKLYNALSPDVYAQWLQALKWASLAEEVKVVVMTGNGKFYTSGQQLGVPSGAEMEGDLEELLQKRCDTTQGVITEFLHFPKLIIAAVQGPAIGFGVTSSALCDVVYSVEEATFNTPFMQLGFCAEACSSVVFPRVMGYSLANEMLLMGRKFTAKEMVACGMVSRLFPQETFMQEVMKAATMAAKYPPQAMKDTKALIRNHDLQFLDQVNEREMKLLVDRMKSEESAMAILQFMEAQAEKKRQQKKASAAKL